MFTKKNLSFFVITLFASNYSVSQVNAQETNTITVEVVANKPAVDSNITIEKGDLIQITDIKGEVAVSGDLIPGNGVTYKGNKNTKPSTSYYQYPNATPHSLVSYIGDSNNHYQVREGIYTEAETSGNLFFGFNDGSRHYGDNKGKFVVTFNVLNKAKLCSPPSSEKVVIQWVNTTGVPIRVNWINFECKEEKSDRLIQPNGIFDGITYVGHLFRVRDEEKGGADIGLISVKSDSGNMNIVK